MPCFISVSKSLQQYNFVNITISRNFNTKSIIGFTKKIRQIEVIAPYFGTCIISHKLRETLNVAGSDYTDYS